MIRWQLELGPVGLVFEFVITVIVIAVASWLLFKKRSPVFWKQTDYVYLIFTIIGGIVAMADLSISNLAKELQQNKIIIDETSSRLRDYVAIGVSQCSIRKAKRDADDAAVNARRDEHIGGIIKPPDDIKSLTPFKESSDKDPSAGIKLWALGLPQFIGLNESDCTFLQNVSAAITSNSLSVMADDAQSYQADGEGGKWSKDAIEAIASDIESINNYSDRDDELEAYLSPLKLLSILKALSPMLLGLGVGIRLARTRFDVKTEQEKQRREAAGIPSPAITTINHGGSESNQSTAISPPIDAITVGEAQD